MKNAAPPAIRRCASNRERGEREINKPVRESSRSVVLLLRRDDGDLRHAVVADRAARYRSSDRALSRQSGEGAPPHGLANPADRRAVERSLGTASAARQVGAGLKNDHQAGQQQDALADGQGMMASCTPAERLNAVGRQEDQNP